MCHQFCLFCIYGVLADFEQVLLYCTVFLCQKHLYIGVILQYNSGSMAATLNK